MTTRKDPTMSTGPGPMYHETTLADVIELAERDPDAFVAWFDRLPPDERRMLVRLMEQASALAEAVRLMEQASALAEGVRLAERAAWN